MTSTPAMTLPSEVAETGSLSVSPPHTTRFRLKVSNLFGHDARDVDVAVISASNGPTPLGESMADPSAGCDAANLWVTAKAPPEFWDRRLTVGLVGSRDGRTYTVEHGGIVGTVSPDHPSMAFVRQRVAGPWKLTTPLQAGEACGHNVPPTLVVDLYPACAP